MEIENWEEISNEELELVADDAFVEHIKHSLHVTEVLRKYKDESFRSLYELSTGKLIRHEKLKYKIDFMKKGGTGI